MKHFAFITALCLLPASASAATFFGGQAWQLDVPLSDNAYVAGESISLEEDVRGDLHAVTGRSTITGNIEDDLYLASGEIHLSGNVGDDLRIAGGTIYSSSSIGGEAIIFGGEVILYDGFSVNGDTWIFAGDAEITGDFDGDVHVYGDRVVIRGTISGDAFVSGTNVNFQSKVRGSTQLSAQELEIGNQASIGGDLRYWQPGGEYYLSDTEVKGEAIYDAELAYTETKIDKTAVGKTAGVAIAAIFGYAFLSAILSIVVLSLIANQLFANTALIIRKQYWRQLLHGFVYVILMPVVIFVFFVTIIGIPLAAVLLCLYLFSFLFTNCFSSLVVTHWLQDQYKKKWHPALIMAIAVGIYVALKVVAIVPFIGSLAVLMLHLAVLGALGTALLGRWKK